MFFLRLVVGALAPMAPSVALAACLAAFAMIRPNFEPSPEPPDRCLDPRLMLVSFARFRASRRLMYSVPCSHTMAAPAPYAGLRGAFCAACVCAPVYRRLQCRQAASSGHNSPSICGTGLKGPRDPQAQKRTYTGCRVATERSCSAVPIDKAEVACMAASRLWYGGGPGTVERDEIDYTGERIGGEAVLYGGVTSGK